MNMITIILPCAGKGSRLGLNYPKELYEIFSDIRLIDFSLDHISAFASLDNKKRIKVVVVTTPEKIEVYDYVKNRLKDIEVKMVRFNSCYEEWPGSVYSARQEFSSKNIVFLPDTFLSISENDFLKDDKGDTIIDKFNNLLDISSVVFGIVECNDGLKLRNLGALKTLNNSIVDFNDKPQSELFRYNGYWAAYGFSEKIGENLYKFLVKNVKKINSDIKNEKFYPPAFFKIENHIDLGTWSSIEKFKKSHYLSSAIIGRKNI